MFSTDESILTAGWETFCYAIPCILLGIAVVFRLDGLFASPARRSGKLTPIPGSDNRGQPVLRDPDGNRF